MTKALETLATLTFASFLIPMFSFPVRADTCSSTPVTARGEESRYVWLAKTKTRATWRAKVRAHPDLGPDYSNWARAHDTEERCLTGPNGTVCIFTGTPCRP
ncbi:MAG: hypothetical protein QM780_13065 [Hyphomicrobium sp.]|uniref:hypothetical protein n=1 Tax=Hyphomicrobium sp. TaxID=82 RepID=UPI0039E5C308